MSTSIDTGVNVTLIIDGQQRLITVSLILLALYNNIKEGNIEVAGEPSEKDIYSRLVYEYGGSLDAKLKLRLVDKYQAAYKVLFDQKDIVENSNITINYRYFYERIKKNEISGKDIYKALESLEIINIELGSDDNPQLVFESLNSTGLALTEGDKVRNLILMDLDYNIQ